MTRMEKSCGIAIPNQASHQTDIDAYTYLRQIWNDYLQPVHIRLRAAAIGIEFERPRFQLSAQVSTTDFAALLDQRIKRHQERLEEMKLIAPPQPMPIAERMRRRI